MTYREAWVEALRRAGAPDDFIKEELKRDTDGIFGRDADKQMVLLPGADEESLICELTGILSNPNNLDSFVRWLESTIEASNRRN